MTARSFDGSKEAPKIKRKFVTLEKQSNETVERIYQTKGRNIVVLIYTSN